MELKIGDIIIFKAEDHWLSKAICWLTDSDVCHAAMVYSDESIVECVAPGVCVNPVSFKSGDEFIMLRMTPNVDPGSLLAIADSYRKAEICYDFSGLILFGGLLLIKKLTPFHQLFPLINQILLCGCKKLNNFIHHALLHKEPGMVCSQFVYQAYFDCGKDYHIILKNASAQNSIQSQGSDIISLSAPASSVCLIDHLNLDALNSFDLNSLDLSSSVPDSFDHIQDLSSFQEPMSEEQLETLCQQFLSIVNPLSAEQSAADKILLSALPENTVKLAEAFLLRIRKLLALTGSKFSLDSMFVTPADLAYHTENLETIGYGALDRK